MSNDKHLNLFYTYNRDTELIENNLTRAFIVFLSILSGQTRNHFLRSIRLAKANDPSNKIVGIGDLDFTAVQFALQGNIDPQIPRNATRKILLTISTDSSDISEIDLVPTDEANGESTPDGWIYDDSRAFCILIESKIGTNPLDMNQIRRHVSNRFGSTLEEIKSTGSWYSTTWIDVLEILDVILNKRSYSKSVEDQLIAHLMGFMNFYGYHLFDGIDFSGLQPPPNFRLLISSPEERRFLMNEQDKSRFITNAIWFNQQFFRDLKTLFEIAFDEMLSEYLSEDTERKTLFYYPKENSIPSIPPYYVYMIKGKQYAFQVYAILDPNRIAMQRFFVAEPSIIVFLHSHPDHFTYVDEYAGRLFRNQEIQIDDQTNGMITGKINKSEVDFFSFQVLFDKLSDRSAIQGRIADPIIEYLKGNSFNIGAR